MKEKYARVDLSKLNADLRKEFEGIKEDSDNFDPELVPIFEDNFKDAYALAEKHFPESIKKGGTVTKTRKATVKKPVAKKKATAKKEDKPELRGYSKSISEATGVTDQETLDKLEDYMRHEIFHSTLDWQTKAEFNKGAREALEMHKEIEKQGPQPWEFTKKDIGKKVYYTSTNNPSFDESYPPWTVKGVNIKDGKVVSLDLENAKGGKLSTSPVNVITEKPGKDLTPKSQGMKKAGYAGEIKKGDVFLWQDPGPNPDPESETEIRGVDKERGQVSYMESYASIVKGMDIDRFRKGIKKKVSGKSESSGANEVEECRKILNNAGYATKKKLSKDGKKAMKVKEPRPERTIIKDKVGDTFKTIMKDVSGSKEKDEKYGPMQKKLSELQDLFTKLFSRLNNLAEDNKIEDADKIIALLKKMVN